MIYADDFSIGDSFDLGTYEISEQEIVDFARRYDPQDYHLSRQKGGESHFGGLVASGWNTAGIWMRLYVTAMLRDSAVQGSPGVDELRWLRPVRPGDVLRGKVTVLAIAPSLSRRSVSVVKKRGTLVADNSEEQVMTLILHSMFQRRS